MADETVALPAKQCKRCGVTKPLTKFHTAKLNRDGYNTTCKVCRRDYMARHYVLNRERIIAQVLSRYQQQRNENPERVLAQKAAQMRKWRAKNVDKVAEKNKARNAKRLLDPEPLRAAERARYAANAEKYRTKTRFWLENHPGYSTEKHREWRNANPDKSSANDRNKRARKRKAEGTHSAADIAEILRLQKGRCAICGLRLKSSDTTADHIVPVVKGGTNYRRNIQLACRSCNSSKRDRDPIDHMRSLGRLI